MHIYCPKCNAGYEIDEQLLEDQAKKLKCSNCGEVFLAADARLEENEVDEVKEEAEPFDLLHEAMREDGVTEEETVANEETQEGTAEVQEDVVRKEAVADNPEPVSDNVVDEESSIEAESSETEVNVEKAEPDDKSDAVASEEADADNVDLESIFVRLSEHTEHLMEQEKKLPFYEKIWLQIKNVLGFHFKIKWAYVMAFIAAFVLLSLFNNRYQIVRELPFLNSVYKVFGINAKIPGEGLEFQNIGWEFFDDDEGNRLEIKGFVYNKSEHDVTLPTIHIELLDKDTVLVQSQNREAEVKVIETGAKIALNLTVENPAPIAKYVYLTFIDAD